MSIRKQHTRRTLRLLVVSSPKDPPDWQQRNLSPTVSQHYCVGGPGLPNPTSGTLADIVRSVSPVDCKGLLLQPSPDGEVEKLRIARWKVAGQRRLKILAPWAHPFRWEAVNVIKIVGLARNSA